MTPVTVNLIRCRAKAACPACTAALVKYATARQGRTLTFDRDHAAAWAAWLAYRRCDHPAVAPANTPSVARFISGGVAGLSRAVAGSVARTVTRQPLPQWVEDRLAHCKPCPRHKDVTFGGLTYDGCEVCKCSFWGKVRDPKACCPLEPPKWGPSIEEAK